MGLLELYSARKNNLLNAWRLHLGFNSDFPSIRIVPGEDLPRSEHVFGTFCNPECVLLSERCG